MDTHYSNSRSKTVAIGGTYTLRIACFLLLHFSGVLTAQCSMVPASFVFGDSLVDAGNNNFIASLAKANYAANGIDFEGGIPTGRFCNGRMVPDIVGQLMGLPFAPVFLDTTTIGDALLKGVNYASGGAGILDDTGENFIQRIPLNQQLAGFRKTRNQLQTLIGHSATNKLFASSLFSFTIGSNDYLNNYFLPGSPRSRLYSARTFQHILISEFRKQLTTVYNLGARKVVVANVGPLGCIPFQRTVRLKPPGSCDNGDNNMITSYNRALKRLIGGLNANLTGCTFVYLNAYDIVLEMIAHPGKYGFENVDHACCGAGGVYSGIVPCLPTTPVCEDRSKYIFWDPFHPTDAVNAIISNRFYNGSVHYADPMNIKQLIQLGHNV